ncbi:MAG: ABC transporter, permease protein 1 (cluster 1, maltose/g3p/polyamine/iron), partial [uncultured Thermoleophilia bacterium]
GRQVTGHHPGRPHRGAPGRRRVEAPDRAAARAAEDLVGLRVHRARAADDPGLHGLRDRVLVLDQLPGLGARQRRAAVRRARELPRPGRRPALRPGARQHRVLHVPVRAARHDRRTVPGAAPEQGDARPRHVPGAVLLPLDHALRDRRDHLEVDLQRRLRVDELLPGQARDHRRPVALARRPEPGHAGDHPDERLGGRGRDDDPLPGGAPGHLRGPLRRRQGRRRRAVAPPALHHVPDARPDHRLPVRGRRDRLVPDLRADLRDDERRAARPHDHHRVLHLPERLQVLRHGLRVGDLVRAVRAPADVHRPPVPALAPLRHPV